MEFKAKIWKTGGSYVSTIPMAYIQNGQLEAGKEYRITIKEVVSDGNNGSSESE